MSDAPAIEPVGPAPVPPVAPARRLPGWGWGLIVAGTAVLALLVGSGFGFGAGFLLGHRLPSRDGFSWTVTTPGGGTFGGHGGGGSFPGGGPGSGGWGDKSGKQPTPWQTSGPYTQATPNS